MTWLMAALAATAAVGALSAEPPSTWNCPLLQNTSLAPGAWWTTLNCTGRVPRLDGLGFATVGPVLVNLAHAVQKQKGPLRLRPAVATTALGLAKLHELAASVARPDFTPLAGVNGGYFFEVNRDDFFDDVCFGKVRKDAQANVSDADANAGIGDSITILNGTYASHNCDKAGNSKPAAAVLDYPPHFVKLDRGEKLPAGVRWAIGAGPNLVSRNPGGTSVIDIEGDNVNIVEHASNTAIALKGSVMMLVTFDGEDGCTEYKPTCGVDSRQFAHFLLDHLRVDTAMEMDQGGSTAMWVKGQASGTNGIVTNPTVAERELFNGVFIGV